jgi:hypothetical protein
MANQTNESKAVNIEALIEQHDEKAVIPSELVAKARKEVAARALEQKQAEIEGNILRVDGYLAPHIQTLKDRRDSAKDAKRRVELAARNVAQFERDGDFNPCYYRNEKIRFEGVSSLDAVEKELNELGA